MEENAKMPANILTPIAVQLNLSSSAGYSNPEPTLLHFHRRIWKTIRLFKAIRKS